MKSGCVFILVWVIVGFRAELFAQSNAVLEDMKEREKTIAKTSLNLEMGGNALLYSLNFDRVLIQTDHYKGTIRIGAGLLPNIQTNSGNSTWLFIPIEYNNLFGPKNHFLEVSLGTTYSNSLQGANHWITGRVGYRASTFQEWFLFQDRHGAVVYSLRKSH